MPPRFLLEQLPGQRQGIIDANLFLEPTKKFPKEFSEQDKKRLTSQTTKAVNNYVFPAYKKFAKFLRTEYDPKGRHCLPVENLTDGKRAALRRSRENDDHGECHARRNPRDRRKEVERVTAEMTKLAQNQGHKDLASFRKRLKTIRSGNRQASSRIPMTTKHTSIKWNRSCRNCCSCCRSAVSCTDSRFRQSSRDPLRAGDAGWETSRSRGCCSL